MKYIYPFFLFFPLFFSAQKTLFFGEFYGGLSRIPEHKAWLYGLEANVQRKNILYSFRYAQNYYQFIKVGTIAGDIIWLPFPVSEGPKYLDDYALLAGYRKAEDGFSYSFSGGISMVQYTEIYYDENNTKYKHKENGIGFPFEANIKWFKKNKSKYRIYGLIPVGKPTSVGNSIGFKLMGSISKNSYVGIGLVWGIGKHQEY